MSRILITRFGAALCLAPLLGGVQGSFHSLHHSLSSIVVSNSENPLPRDGTASSAATETGKPVVHGPVAPGVQPNDLTDSPAVKPWKPGEPVRVRPDLKKSGDSQTR